VGAHDRPSFSTNPSYSSLCTDATRRRIQQTSVTTSSLHQSSVIKQTPHPLSHTVAFKAYINPLRPPSFCPHYSQFFSAYQKRSSKSGMSWRACASKVHRITKDLFQPAHVFRPTSSSHFSTGKIQRAIDDRRCAFFQIGSCPLYGCGCASKTTTFTTHVCSSASLESHGTVPMSVPSLPERGPAWCDVSALQKSLSPKSMELCWSSNTPFCVNMVENCEAEGEGI
jgi:hypothetical protein